MTRALWVLLLFFGSIWCLTGYKAVRAHGIGRRRWQRILLSPFGLLIDLIRWLNQRTETTKAPPTEPDMVRLPRNVVMDAIPMLFWVSQVLKWDDPMHRKVLDDLYREAATAVGVNYTQLEDPPHTSQG